MTPCERCDKPQDDHWPGDKGELCQECWEQACDAAWWAAHQAIARVVTPDSFPDEAD